MFDENTKAAWQGIQPGPALKDRVLALEAQPQSKTIPFPGKKTLRALTGLAACIVAAVILLNPMPRVTLTGYAPGTATAAFSRQAEAQPLTLHLAYDGESTLTVSQGTLEVQGESLLWHLPGPGNYILTAVRGGRTVETHFQVLLEEGVLSVTTH